MQQYDSFTHALQGSTILKSNQHYARLFSSSRKETENQKSPKVEIVSKGFIKPTTPTPLHLRTYKFSLADQLFPHVYMSFVYFYPNNHHENDDGLILRRRQNLRQSLSEILTKFYPFAGRIKNNLQIDCNDDGVYYVEAKVDDLNLSDFLKNPDNKSTHKLLPLDPNSEELLSRNDLVMTQVTTFGCGGISIGLYTSHKIVDGFSLPTFVNAWASAARAPSEQNINPIFISSSINPFNPALPQDAYVFAPQFSKSKIATKRFLFDASSLATLKQKANSSRVSAVMGLIWKAANSKAMNNNDKVSLSLAVNLRNRFSPPAPPHSIGNVIFTTDPIQWSSEDNDLEGPVKRIKAAVNQFNSEYLQKWRENWLLNPEAILNEMKLWFDYINNNEDLRHISSSSICNSGMYEADFGWGKPIWVCPGVGDSKTQWNNTVFLLDTSCGTGIEAWITLREQKMRIFERDPELLAFASSNAPPLQLHE